MKVEVAEWSRDVSSEGGGRERDELGRRQR